MTYRAARAITLWSVLSSAIARCRPRFPIFAWNDPERHRYPWIVAYKPEGYGHCSWPAQTQLLHRVFHVLDHLLSRQAYAAFQGFLVWRVGVLDSHEEGGVVFWRWAFWRSNHRRALKLGAWPTRAA